MSLSHPKPSEAECSSSVGKAKKMVIFAKDRDKEFSNEFIYLTFFSFSGMAVEINPRFTEEDKDLEAKKQKEAE